LPYIYTSSEKKKKEEKKQIWYGEMEMRRKQRKTDYSNK